jgi:hypothetical protein
VNHSWALQPLGLTPGNMLTLQVRARDFQPSATTQAVAEPVEAAGDTRAPGVAAAAGVGESVAYTLRVVTREELLAELGRREQEWRREFEQIIKSQEQLNTRIMDLRDTAARGGESEDLAVRYGQEGRTQRQQIGRLKTIRVQFEQIVAELKTNQLDTPPVRRRLSEGVIAPLARLIGTDVVEAADMVDRLRQRFDMALADELERRQAQIVQTMYAVLANMLKWEGYNEAVALLQDIVRLQGDVNRQTQARLEREIERLFGSEPTTKPETRP